MYRSLVLYLATYLQYLPYRDTLPFTLDLSVSCHFRCGACVLPYYPNNTRRPLCHILYLYASEASHTDTDRRRPVAHRIAIAMPR
jgi:hypothetical protein